MARRQKVFGLPIGKKKRPSIAPKVIGAGLAAIPAVVAARKAAGAVSEGSDKVHQVTDVAQKAQQVMGAMGDHSSTIGKVGAAVKQVKQLTGGKGGSGSPKLSHLIEEHTEVAVPRSVAYNQWTQFETFPSIVKGAERVEQKERDQVEWTAKIGPSHRTWKGEITEQVPDERIAWKSGGGLQLKGVVTFHSITDDLTRVLVQMEYTPQGPVEGVGNVLRMQRRRVRRDLRLFKHFVELRGEETGAWRSRIAKKGDGDGSDGDSSEQSKSSAPARAGRAVAHESRRATATVRRATSSGSRSGSRPGAAKRQGSRTSAAKRQGPNSSTAKRQGSNSSGGGKATAGQSKKRSSTSKSAGARSSSNGSRTSKASGR